MGATEMAHASKRLGGDLAKQLAKVAARAHDSRQASLLTEAEDVACRGRRGECEMRRESSGGFRMTTLPGWDRPTSPYHAGETLLQERLGRKDIQEVSGRRVHRTFMPEQHRAFFNQLPFMVIGSVDAAGWPWASVVFGKPGFVTSPGDRRLEFAHAPLDGDPLGANLSVNAPIGLLGIEPSTRRRNRMNGMVGAVDGEGFAVDVVQSYGNCPQYIQTRSPKWVRDPAARVALVHETFKTLDPAAVNLIASADTFFVASHNDRDDPRDTGGVDVSHRGGKPGFVKVEADTLTVPDYVGNFSFNTLGNFLINPRAGLVFIDFDTGDLLLMTGTVELIWDSTPEVEAFTGAERAWRFTLDHGIRLKDASPLRWEFGEYSPNSLLTGTWDEAGRRLEAANLRKAWLPYRVAQVVDESATIRSFHLEPTAGNVLFAHEPGQFLTIRVSPAGASKPLVRTYTLSSAPADPMYRISVKREGVVSTYLHEAIKPGDTIEARAPLGSFTLDTRERRPAVLLAGGVGITPMVSMTRQAVSEGVSHRHIRPLTVIHSTRNMAERPFLTEFRRLADASDGAVRYVSILSQAEDAAKEGLDYDFGGRLSHAQLQRILPLADYDFFLCGPPSFMQSCYDMLRDLGVPDRRILAEGFGPSALDRVADAGLADTTPARDKEADSAAVSFTGAKFEQTWTPEQGTLLEFAESHGLSPAHGCRSGNCGSCATRLLAGKVVYRLAPEFETGNDEILICCSVPAAGTEHLELDL